MKAYRILEECENRLSISERTYWRTLWYSFTSNFKKVVTDMVFFFDNDEEKENFIRICDNRIQRVKTLYNQTTIAIGLDITILAIVAKITVKGEQRIVRYLLFEQGDIFSKLFCWGLIILLAIFVAYLLHFRTHLHGWTAFKESSILGDYEGRKNKI